MKTILVNIFALFLVLQCHAQDAFKFRQRLDTSRYVKETKPVEELQTYADTEPSYPGDSLAWQRFLYENLRYPKKAFRKKIQGTVVVEFIIDNKGEVDSVQAVSGPEKYGLREEAIRVVTISGKWNPAKRNGALIKSHKQEEIEFKLD